MDRCRYCHHSDGTHAEGCPAVDPSQAQEYFAGWNRGRAGNNLPLNPTPTFDLGWCNGRDALKNAENGRDTSGFA